MAGLLKPTQLLSTTTNLLPDAKRVLSKTTEVLSNGTEAVSKTGDVLSNAKGGPAERKKRPAGG
jgi:hypothetical protein